MRCKISGVSGTAGASFFAATDFFAAGDFFAAPDFFAATDFFAAGDFFCGAAFLAAPVLTPAASGVFAAVAGLSWVNPATHSNRKMLKKMPLNLAKINHLNQRILS